MILLETAEVADMIVSAEKDWESGHSRASRRHQSISIEPTYNSKAAIARVDLLPSTLSETAVESLAIDPEKNALTIPPAPAPKVAEPPEKALLLHTRISPGPTANILSRDSTFCDVPNRTEDTSRGAEI